MITHKALHILLIVVLGLAVGITADSYPSEWPLAKATAKVIDEAGRPIANAQVSIGFVIPLPPGGGAGTKDIVSEGKSDSQGEFSAQGRSMGTVSVGARREGFYPTTIGLPFVFTGRDGGRWQPWDARFDLILKPIVNPTSLYAKRVEDVTVPVINEPVGYDMEKGDWIAPHGRGVTADFFIQVQRSFQSVEEPFEGKLAVTFPNRGDGAHAITAPPFTGSTLRLPHAAPADGYEVPVVKWTRKSRSSPIDENFSREQCYFLRTRTRLENGKVESAHYSKVQDDFSFDIINSPTALIRFTYYFNPTPNDRNLEFDRTKNLFGELPFGQRVSAP